MKMVIVSAVSRITGYRVRLTEYEYVPEKRTRFSMEPALYTRYRTTIEIR